MIPLRSLAFAFLLALALHPAAIAQQTPRIFPYEPGELLAVLPPAPSAEWTVTRSEADSSLGDWVETRATRTFTAPPTPPATPDAAPAPAGEAEVSITDTAGFLPSLAAFANFTPGKSGAVERKLLGSLPTIIFTGEDGRQITQVLVSARYIVEVTFTQLPPQRVEDWLRTLHFDFLPPKPNTPAVRPREFRLSHVDELHPANSRSYFVSATNSQRVDAFLKTLPPAE